MYTEKALLLVHREGAAAWHHGPAGLGAALNCAVEVDVLPVPPDATFLRAFCKFHCQRTVEGIERPHAALAFAGRLHARELGRAAYL